MNSSSAAILLPSKEEVRGSGRKSAVPGLIDSSAKVRPQNFSQPFLRVPPFPGAHLKTFERISRSGLDSERAAAEIKRARVGGTFWGAQPQLPDSYVLVASADGIQAAERIADGRQIVRWTGREGPVSVQGSVISGECDPWHMLAGATVLVADTGDELHVIASLLGCPASEIEPATGEDRAARIDLHATLEEELGGLFENPFSDQPMDGVAAIGLCAFWRDLIDSNREIAGGFGFAFWKQSHIAPLLWGGTEPVRFLRNAANVASGSHIAVWRSKVSEAVDLELEREGAALIEVEDGFLRSRGLGADCVPPLSITVDRLGAHFDPSRESELERLLEHGKFDEPLLECARHLRRSIVDSGLGKYDCSHETFDRPAPGKTHILVPGQVEDDRAVIRGGCGLVSNLELLKCVRAQAPDAYVLFKPHPDVLAGHRKGAVAEASALEYADEIVGDVPISALIAMVDEVHVNTSLAGFEALLRDKRVTTYGVPFYAGWGLTNDLGPVPTRRTARRSIDELVAAALILYPRYFDPVTGLPCPAEVVVTRLSGGGEGDASLVVGLRRLQGKVMRRLRSLVQ